MFQNVSQLLAFPLNFVVLSFGSLEFEFSAVCIHKPDLYNFELLRVCSQILISVRIAAFRTLTVLHSFSFSSIIRLDLTSVMAFVSIVIYIASFHALRARSSVGRALN